jgi:hypothetical protein
MKRPCLFAFLVVVLTTVCARAEQSHAYKHLPEFTVPKEFRSAVRFHPVDYLRTYPIPDPKTVLNPDQKRRLERLFVAAYDACMAKYRQDYLLPTDAPIYQLLRDNNPKIAALPPMEGGRVVFLGSIAEAVRAECCPAQTRPDTSASPSGRLKTSNPAKP